MSAAVRLQRSRTIRAPIECAWEWMCDHAALELFRANLFHAEAQGDGEPLRVGSEVRIRHRFLWAHELRVARISKLALFQIAWGETKEQGEDWFPHYQSFVLEPAEAGCRLHNSLSGTFRLRGARWWLLPWYRHVLPGVLHLENRKIARAIEDGLGAVRTGSR